MKLSTRESNQIKNRILDVISSYKDDITAIYYIENTGELYKKYKIARGDEQKLQAIGIQLVTQTRLSVAISVRVKVQANVPELYQQLKNSLKDMLSEEKLSLYDFKMKVVSAE
jgi:hypothetical protein